MSFCSVLLTPQTHTCVAQTCFSLRSILVPERCFVLKTGEVAVGQPDTVPGISRLASVLLGESEKVDSCPFWHPQALPDC